MPNYDGEYEIRIFYETVPTGFQAMEHVLTFDVVPQPAPSVGTDFADIDILRRDNTTTPLDTAIDAFVAGMIAIYHSSSTIIRAELWYIPEGTFAGTFISAYAIDEAGTAVGATVVAQQNTLTFRSILGGSGRLQFMESSVTGNTKQSYPYANAAMNAIANLVTPVTGWIHARDNSPMFANIHESDGQNERLYRKRYRT